MAKRRLIFTLHIQKGIYQLSRNFSLQEAGGLNWIKEFYNFNSIIDSIDELIVLNVGRGERDLAQFSKCLIELTHDCFMPMAAGGGIRTMDDAFTLMRSGADKLVVNTPLITQPELIRSLVKTFGRQCVVASIDYKKNQSATEVFIENGSRSCAMTVEAAVKNAQELGVGEIYLTSILRDGTGQGYDLETIKRVAHLAEVPIVVAGGVGTFEHLAEGLNAGADAVATANLFNFMGDGLTEARTHLKNRGVDLALWKSMSGLL